MADLNKLEAHIAKGGLRRYRGIMVRDSAGKLVVNVNGNQLFTRFQDPVVVAAGDAVIVDMLSGETGQAEGVVTGRLTAAPRPARGIVKTVPVGSPTVTVTGTDGVDYSADFVASYTPATGNEVILAWNAATPTIQGRVSETAAPPPPPPPIIPPPPKPQTGRGDYRCVDAGTYWSGGGWNSVNSARGGQVLQGIVYGTSNQVQGSFFYGGSPKELAGRTPTRIRIQMTMRMAIGNHNAPATLVFQCHTSERRPGGAVTLAGPTHTVVIPAGWAGGLLDLPTALSPWLFSGGGISIIGTDYAGFLSRTEDPSTGQLFIDWSR